MSDSRATPERKRVYLVWRHTGYYSDRRSEVIFAYDNRESAETRIHLIEEFLRNRPMWDFDRMTDDGGKIKPYWKGKMRNPHDPEYGDGYDNLGEVPDYTLQEIPLESLYERNT